MAEVRKRSSGRKRPEVPNPIRPWARVPSQLATILHPVVPQAIDSVVEAVEAEISDYRVDPDDPIRKGLLAGVRVALERLLDLLGTSHEALADAADLYDRIGAFEYKAGRPLEDVLSAYRVGATTTWQVFSEAVVSAGSSPRDVATLAEACFAYINEIAATSTAGYARAQAADAGARSRVRSQLVASLVAGDAHSAGTAELARRAGWPVPESVVAVLLPNATPGSTMARLNEVHGFVAAETEHGQVALCRGALDQRDKGLLERILGGQRAAAGTLQPVSHTSSSLRHANTLASHRDAWGIPESGIAWAEAHLPALLVTADKDLGEMLSERMLQPLLKLPADRREPLLATLRWWLLLHGARGKVAKVMMVHPQTISYRMDRIRALVGEDLDQPDKRWATLLALMSRSPEGHGGSAKTEGISQHDRQGAQGLPTMTDGVLPR